MIFSIEFHIFRDRRTSKRPVGAKRTMFAMCFEEITIYGFSFTVFYPQIYRSIITSFGILPSLEFHIFWDRFSWAMFDPVMYRFFTICFRLLPAFEFHIFWDRFAWTKLDPKMYRFSIIYFFRFLPTFKF